MTDDLRPDNPIPAECSSYVLNNTDFWITKTDNVVQWQSYEYLVCGRCGLEIRKTEGTSHLSGKLGYARHRVCPTL